jgi:hypothetical protein
MNQLGQYFQYFQWLQLDRLLQYFQLDRLGRWGLFDPWNQWHLRFLCIQLDRFGQSDPFFQSSQPDPLCPSGLFPEDQSDLLIPWGP